MLPSFPRGLSIYDILSRLLPFGGCSPKSRGVTHRARVCFFWLSPRPPIIFVRAPASGLWRAAPLTLSHSAAGVVIDSSFLALTSSLVGGSVLFRNKSVFWGCQSGSDRVLCSFYFFRVVSLSLSRIHSSLAGWGFLLPFFIIHPLAFRGLLAPRRTFFFSLPPRVAASLTQQFTGGGGLQYTSSVRLPPFVFCSSSNDTTAVGAASFSSPPNLVCFFPPSARISSVGEMKLSPFPCVVALSLSTSYGVHRRVVFSLSSGGGVCFFSPSLSLVWVPRQYCVAVFPSPLFVCRPSSPHHHAVALCWGIILSLLRVLRGVGRNPISSGGLTLISLVVHIALFPHVTQSFGKILVRCPKNLQSACFSEVFPAEYFVCSAQHPERFPLG